MSAYSLKEFDFPQLLKNCQDRNAKIICRINIKIKIEVSIKFSKKLLDVFFSTKFEF